MLRDIVPFAEGPRRETQILSLGFFRTGSQSLKEALEILGYQDVFHSCEMSKDASKFRGFELAADDNIPCLPTYTGNTWTREQWDQYIGPCEALTDLTPFAYPLLSTYPEAKVILVYRDFDAWAKSYLETLVVPSSSSLLARLSGNVFEPIVGLGVSKTLWKMYMGLFGVSDIRKARDMRIMREGYERHYDMIRRMVPKEQLLDINLKELSWEPLCEFLCKKVPDRPFPRANESKIYKGAFGQLHWMAFMGATIKISMYLGTLGVLALLSSWVAKSRGWRLDAFW